MGLWGPLVVVTLVALMAGVVALASQAGGATPVTVTTPSATPTPPRPIPPTPSPTPTPEARPRQTEAPYAIEIPAIGVNANIVPVGRAPDGTMATPENPYAVGWYAAGPKPGSPQNVLLAGHLDFWDAQAGVGRPGVFWRLRQLRSGDLVYLVQDSQRYRYVVQESIKVRYDDPEAINLLAPGRGALITMITCEGPEFDPVARNYLWRRIVVAALWPN